ncbi:hypothetical protein XACM_3161 [Xanthomonas euvesicatoria pv. citrumelo F1]|nr:hypothetical protein XACM_3161 [Xanthomonas euvesicatoria pv. citrumelo F1]
MSAGSFSNRDQGQSQSQSQSEGSKKGFGAHGVKTSVC